MFIWSCRSNKLRQWLVKLLVLQANSSSKIQRMFCQVAELLQREMKMIFAYRPVRNFLLSFCGRSCCFEKIANDIWRGREQHQPKRLGYKFNQNHQLVYEDLTGILGMQRFDSEYVQFRIVPNMKLVPARDWFWGWSSSKYIIAGA
jgi:hypothetical protein